MVDCRWPAVWLALEVIGDIDGSTVLILLLCLFELCWLQYLYLLLFDRWWRGWRLVVGSLEFLG